VPDLAHDPRFLHYAVIGARPRLDRHIDRAAHGTARLLDSVMTERIAIPGLSAQAQIADFLDRECARIDELERELVTYEALVAPRWLAAFKRRVVAERARRRLKFFGAGLILGPFGSLLSADEYVVGGIPVVNPVHIAWDGIRPDDRVTVPKHRAADLLRYQLRPGDVILARRGELGRAAVVSIEDDGFLCGTGSARLRASARLDPHFLVLFLLTRAARDELKLTSVGATMANLDTNSFLHLSLPDWERPAQAEAVAEALRARTGVQLLEQEIYSARTGLREYRDALISEAVTGKLDVTRLSDSRMDESLAAAREGEAPEVLAS
jgi:type I restriction enzyme S subunit